MPGNRKFCNTDELPFTRNEEGLEPWQGVLDAMGGGAKMGIGSAPPRSGAFSQAAAGVWSAFGKTFGGTFGRALGQQVVRSAGAAAGRALVSHLRSNVKRDRWGSGIR